MLKTQIAPAPSSTIWYQGLAVVYQERKTYEFKKGYRIPLYPNTIWIVCRGIVKLSTFNAEGDEMSLGIVFPEMPFGLPLTQIEPYDAIGLTHVVLVRIHEQEIEQSPLLAQRMRLQLHRRLQQLATWMVLVHHHPVSRRLQKLLLLMAREVGEQTPEGIRIGVRLSHQQLADITGINRVTSTRILSLLQTQGWLSFDQTRHIVVHESAVVDLQKFSSPAH